MSEEKEIIPLCVVCKESPQVMDSSACEYSTGMSRDPDTTYNYPEGYDDYCEDCLDQHFKDLAEDAAVSRHDDAREDRERGFY